MIDDEQLTPQDRAVLETLKNAGSNLTKTHLIDYYLYFKTMRNSTDVAERLEAGGFNIEVSKRADEKQWLVLASHKIVPNESLIAKTTQLLRDLAVLFDGEYDGWETQIMD